MTQFKSDFGYFPDTKRNEELEYRPPKGPIDTTLEAVGIVDKDKDKSDEPARFGDEPGQIIVNPLTVNKVFNYGEYFNEDFFNENKVNSFVYGEGANQITQSFDTNMPYEDKIAMFNQYQPRFLITKSDELDDKGMAKTAGIYNVDERIDTILRSNIEAKIESEVDKGISGTLLPNPFTDAPAILSTEYYARDPKTGRLLPSYSDSPGRRAKDFLKFMDKSFPNMSAKTKAGLINRNIYGRSDLRFKMPEETETLTAGSGLKLGEKIYTVATDIPRALTDLVITAVGGGLELGYDGLKNLINLSTREATFKDASQKIGFLPNPFSETGRDLLRSYLGPDAAERYRLRLAEDNILVSKEQAHKILHYASDTADKISIVVPALVAEAGLIAKVGKGAAKKLFEQDFKLFAQNNKDLKQPELVSAFLESRRAKFPIYKQLKSILDKSKFKAGADLAESGKPVELRSMVVDAKDRLKTVKNELADALKAKRAEYQALDPLAKSLMTPLLKKEYYNTEKIRKLKIQKMEAEMGIRIAEQTSAIPKYIRDMYRDSTLFATVAAATGQQLNVSFGIEPEVGYLVGMGVMISASLSQNNNLLGMRSYLDNQTYNSANMLTYFRKSGVFGDDLTSQEVLKILSGPDLSRFKNAKERKIAVELAQRINTLTPEVRDQIVANIMYYKGVRKDLTKPISEGGAGLSDEVLETSFADMAGLAFYDVLEDSFYYSFSQTKAFDADTASIIQGIQKNRTNLMRGLEKSLKTILGSKDIDKNNPALVQFTGKISEALNDSKLKDDGLRAIADNYIKSKTMLLETYLHGHDTKGLRAEMQVEYGSVINMAESLLDDVDKLSFIKETRDVVKVKKTIDTIQKTINKEFHATIANHHRRLLESPKMIPNVNMTELSKYNDENASLARLAMMNRKLAETRAKLPFKNFDIKYGDIYGTDASELGFKILDQVKSDAGTRASKALVSQLMKSTDEKRIFTVLNSGATRSVDALIEATGNTNLRDLYITKIRNDLPDNLKNQAITDLDIVSYINRSGASDLQGRVGIALNIEQTQNLYSALSRRAYKASRDGDTNLSSVYGGFRDDVDELFDKVIDVQGNELSSDLLATIREEIIDMRRVYQDEYTTPFLTEGTNVSRWTNPQTATKVNSKGEVAYEADSARFPSGKVWKTGDTPNTWFNLEKVSKMDDASIQKLNDDYTMMYGRYNRQADDYIIDPRGENFKALGVIAAIKFEKEVLRLQETITDPKQLGDAIENLKRKTDLLFRNRRKGDSVSAFKYDESMDNLTGLGLRIRRDEKLEQAYRKNWIPLKQKLISETGAVYTAMRKSQERIKLMTNASQIKTNAGFFNEFIASANGPTELKKLKQSLTTGPSPQMTPGEFDSYVKEIASTHISKLVVKPTGSVTLVDEVVETTDAAGNKITKTEYKAVKDTDFDSGALTDLLSGENSDTLLANLKNLNILDDDHLKNLERINTFMANRLKQARRRGDKNIRVTGEPRGLSIESYISRFYSISRQVVSPKYVATEALIQNIRMAEHRMLKEMIMNPRVASILTELIVDGKKFTEEKELRLKEIFSAMAMNAWASSAISREDEMRSGTRKPEIDFSKLRQQ